VPRWTGDHNFMSTLAGTSAATIRVLPSPSFLFVVRLTLVFVLASVFFQLSLGLGIALGGRGRVAPGLAMGWGLTWIGIGRWSEEPPSEPIAIAAWLAFYVEAQRSVPMRRLLRVYARRLHANLAFALKPLMPTAEAERTAEGIAALIDGLYIRRALKDGPPDAASAIALVEDYLSLRVKGRSHA
jgi:TetR/AcrR family transcriptional repressor of bet genes